jgi:hypothetical protein
LPGDVDPRLIRTGDVTVTAREFRADHVYLVEGPSGKPEWALYLECQTKPDLRALPKWLRKYGNLCDHLGIRVLLVVLYLRPGDRNSFPGSLRVTAGPLVNEFKFHAIRLWEHADRTRSGELVELAPLLVLCEDKPAEEAVREEVELIRASEMPEEARLELLAVAYMLGTRYLLREVLDMIFQGELPPLKELGIIGEWIAEGLEKGREQGLRQGRDEEARRLAELLLQERFGTLPPEVAARIQGAEASWCEDLCRRALCATSLEELEL